MNNDYISIALNDYEYLKVGRQANLYNNDASGAQQVVEKIIKGIILKTQEVTPDVLRTHNLRNLYKRIKHEFPISKESEAFLSTLTDFYFNARYPGDDFIIVDKEDADTSYAVATEFVERVKRWNQTGDNSLSNALRNLSDKYK